MNRAERSPRARDAHISPLRLSMYADGEVSREEREEIEAHLSACLACSTRLDALRSVSAALAQLPRTTPSAGVFDNVLAGARRLDEAANTVARERLGRARGNGPRLREVRLRDMDAPTAAPTRRRTRWRSPFIGALPTIAALLLIALISGLLMRSSLLTTTLPNVTPTPTIPPGDTLKATQDAVERYTPQLAFKPEPPTYLPGGARLDDARVNTLADGARCLDMTWTFSAGPLLTLHLREQPAGASTGGYDIPTTQTGGLAWRLSQHPEWRAMTRVEQAGWIGVKQSSGQFMLLLDAQPAPNAAPSDVAAALRLTSLSLDTTYAMPPIAIGGPLPGSLKRSIAHVTGTGGQMWTWDVTLSADNRQRSATTTTPPSGATVTVVTNAAGAGVRKDPANRTYQIIPGPTAYPTLPKVTDEIAYSINAYLGSGQLWNLGPIPVTLPGAHSSVRVYDLYRVDAALPEHVYADATTGAVVAIYVESSSSISPGGPGSPQPYISTTTCPPYTVTYTWIIYEPTTQSTSLFNTNPPAGWKQGAVALPFTCGG